MQPIEGITPSALWTFLGVLLALCGVVVLIDKVADVWRKYKARKEIGPESKIAEEISKKVIANMKPQFDEIDKKFAHDKAEIEKHARQIAEIDRRVDSQDSGMKALCQGTLALLNHELHNGNSDEMEDAKKVIDTYLINK